MSSEIMAKCNSCGHQWTARNTSAKKPGKCSSCGSRDTYWTSSEDEQNTNNQPQYQQQPFAQPVEAPQEPVFYEARQSAPTRNPTPVEISQMVHESVRQAVREEVAASAPTYQPPQYYPPQYYPPAMDNADREELEALRDEQDRQVRVEERIRDYCGDDTEVIHNPDFVNSNDREVRVGWIDYDTGRPRAAIAVSEDRYHKLIDLEEKERAEECGKESLKDVAKLNRSNKLAVHEGEAMKLSPEEKGGVSLGAVAAVLAVGGIAVVGYVLFNKYLAAKSAQADQEDPKVNSLQKNILMSNKVLRDRFIQSGGRLEV